MDTPLYSLRNLSKTRTRETGYTLLIPELDIYAGEYIGLLGPSGCGKSTALDVLGLALKPDLQENGSFLFRADYGVHHVLDLWRKGQQAALAELRLCHMNYIIQTGGLLPFLTVAENMAVIAQARGVSSYEKQVRQLAERLGIDHLLGEKPQALSVGERQRVAIGRALTGNPRVILADEPTAALDPLNAREVMRLFMDTMNTLPDVTLIMVSHDPSLFELAPFRLLRMETGKSENGGTNAVLLFPPHGPFMDNESPEGECADNALGVSDPADTEPREAP